MGYKIYQEYVDNESGAKGRGTRKEFAQMFEEVTGEKLTAITPKRER